MKAFGRSLWWLGDKSNAGVQGQLMWGVYGDNFYTGGRRTKLQAQLFRVFPDRHPVRFSILNAL